MKKILLPIAALFLSYPAMAQTKLSWFSAPLFYGQTTDANGVKVLTYLATIQSTTPDANGVYEYWVDTKPFYQESFADVTALNERKACDATGDNSCVSGAPGWIEITQTSSGGIPPIE